MTQIQITLTEEENKIVELYKISYNLKMKSDAIKQMIKFFDAEVKYKNKMEKIKQ